MRVNRYVGFWRNYDLRSITLHVRYAPQGGRPAALVVGLLCRDEDRVLVAPLCAGCAQGSDDDVIERVAREITAYGERQTRH